MQSYTRSIRYALLASVGVLAACDNNELQTAPSVPVSSFLAPELALELSNASATPGERIAISIANSSSALIGGVQGDLHFNPSQLRFRGQVRNADSHELMIVNDADASSGRLRVAILDPANLKHSSPLVFDVIGQGYASSISFEPEEVVTNRPTIKVIDAKVARGFVVNSGLQAPAGADRMSIGDWYDALGERDASREPGRIVNGLKYGDTDGNGVISLSDALYIVNVSIGGNEMIIGTDGTGPQGNQDAVVAGNVFPFNIDSAGGAPLPLNLGEPGDLTPPGRDANGGRSLSLADALAITNESISAFQPIVGDIIPGRPTTPVTARTIVTGDITANTTWTPSTIYELSGIIRVTNGATLTIQAGTRIEGQRPVGTTGGSYLAIARDGVINAQGTPLEPIIMTCTLNAGEPPRIKGCWGGLSVLGNASVNETGTLTSPVITGRATAGGCREAAAEGGAGLYGGCNDNDNSGIMRYVRLEYPGFRFNAENELNGLALYGVGRATTVEFVQVHAGLDDAVEMFGGTVNLKYLYLTATSDDAFDFTFGWNGKTQFIVAQHDANDSDNGFENDNATTNFNSLPRATPEVWNVTLVGQRNNRVGVSESQNRGLLIRRGARPRYFNFHVEGFTTALTIANVETCAVDATGDLELLNFTFALNQTLGTVVAGCPSLASIGTVLAVSPLLSPLSVIVPDFRPSLSLAVIGGVPPTDGFFDVTATYIGGVAPATANKSNAPWYSGWTRGWQNSTTP